MADTLWTGQENDKLYATSGQFSAVIKTSQSVGGVDTGPNGISWTGLDTTWVGREAIKLYRTSGQFSATIKTSQSVSGIDAVPRGCSWDGFDTPWCGFDQKLYRTSGQFSATLKTSQGVGGVDIFPESVSWDALNSPWVGGESDKFYLTSASFSATIKTSQAVGVDDLPTGISWNGFDTPWSGNRNNKLLLTSGQFSATIKTSQDVGGVDNTPSGIEHGDFDARVPVMLSGSALGEAFTSGTAAQQHEASGSALGEAITFGGGGFILEGSASALGEASVSGDGTLFASGSGSALGEGFTVGEAIHLRFVSGSLLAEAFTTGEPELFKQTITSSIDVGNNAVFQLTVAGTIIDLAQPFMQPEDLSVSYDGKELVFSEIATPGFGFPSFGPEDAVSLDIDLGSGLFRWFTGEVRIRETIGQNNEEGFSYTAFGFQNLADEVTLINTDGRPEIEFTIGTTVTSIRSDATEVVTSFSKSIQSAMQEMFEINASVLSDAGIPATIGFPGLEQFVGQIPETLSFQNVGFKSAITQLAALETGVKVFFNDQQLKWTFPNLLRSPTAIVEINSLNLLEAVFDTSTEDRFTAVHLFANADDFLDEAIISKIATVSIGGNVGVISRTEVSLTQKWDTTVQPLWTISKAYQGSVGALENEFFWVYRRWSLPTSVIPQWPGTPIRLWQKFDFWGTTTWRRTHGRVLFRRKEFHSRFPLIHRGNPHIPGDVIGPLEVTMAYYPRQFNFTFISTVNSAGTPTFVTTAIDGADFLTDVRVPTSGFEGTAFTQFGVERELVQIVDPTMVTSANANAILRMHKDVVVAGDLPIEGDPLETMLNLDRKIRVQHATLTTGIESTPALLTSYSYRFGKRGENSLSLTTDVAGLISGNA